MARPPPAGFKARIAFLATLQSLCLFAVGATGAGSEEPPVLFKQHCASCHGPDGRAKTPAARKLRVKDLTLSQLTDEGIRMQILNGSDSDAGKSKMPAFKDKLTEEEIETLVVQVKALRLQTP